MRQSSSTVRALLGPLSAVRAFGRLAFGGFILLHFAVEAFRARGDALRPEPGIETAPWFVAALLLVIWLPFALFAVNELATWRSPPHLPETGVSERALGFAERLALLVVIAFALTHGAESAWPLLAGEIFRADVRPELVLTLSSTSHGVPIHAGFYVCGVAAASFYATRQVLAVKRTAPRAVSRAIVVLGVLAYALGSFAVIRGSGGQLFP